MGTPDLAAKVLSVLAPDPRWEIVLVVAQPDKAVGRGLQVQAPPVKAEALARGLPVAQPLKARDPEFLEQLKSLAPDVVLVAAYGQLLPPALLEIPRAGCLNVHTSLLPRWRGAAPIQWAIAEGDPETGVTLMRMDAGLDTGDIVGVAKTPIHATDTGQSLHDRLAEIGANLVVDLLPAWLEGKLAPRPQPAEGVRHARKLAREDGCLDWSQPAVVLDRRIRAFNPWPGAYTTATSCSGEARGLIKVWDATRVEPAAEEPLDAGAAVTPVPGQVCVAGGDRLEIATGQGRLALRVVQREGRRRMSAREFLAGGGLAEGDRLGTV
jgi:methionyl-tRNA formyltransferase